MKGNMIDDDQSGRELLGWLGKASTFRFQEKRALEEES